MDPPVEVEGVHVEVVGAKFLPQFDGSEIPKKQPPKGRMPRPNLRKKRRKIPPTSTIWDVSMYPCIPKACKSWEKTTFSLNWRTPFYHQAYGVVLLSSFVCPRIEKSNHRPLFTPRPAMNNLEIPFAQGLFLDIVAVQKTITKTTHNRW